MCGWGRDGDGDGKRPRHRPKMGAKRLPTRLTLNGSRAGRKINQKGKIMHRGKSEIYLNVIKSIFAYFVTASNWVFYNRRL